jgi:sugar phosphate isomerase/epimerase
VHLAGRNQLIEGVSLAEGFRALKEAGADAVELCHENPAMAPGKMDAALAGRIHDWLGEADLAASATGWHCDFVADDAAFAALPGLIRLAPACGAGVFIIAGAHGTDPELWDPMVERTRRLCVAAADCGVRLACEYEPGFLVEDADSLLRLREEVDSPALGANLDLGHAFLQEGAPLEAVARLGGLILHCHVEGMARGVHRHLPPWEGDLDLAAYLEALKKAGFDGALALDLYGVDYLEVAPRCFAYLRGLLTAE